MPTVYASNIYFRLQTDIYDSKVKNRMFIIMIIVVVVVAIIIIFSSVSFLFSVSLASRSRRGEGATV